MILDRIKKTNDIKKIRESELDDLAKEIRSFLVEHISVTGGHLASNLGAVELTMALHRVLDLPKDKIIWDVGHQCYTHKILTGRKDSFDTLRQFEGISGFPKRSESETDVFDTGHASNSISAGLGLVMARDLSGEDHTVVSVIGDGSLSGGMAYEAMNNAAKLNTNFIIVLNDNNMSINESIGGMSRYLNDVRTMQRYLDLKADVFASLTERHTDWLIEGIRRAKNSVKQLFVPGMFFENLGLTYLGPVDGHDVKAMQRAFREARRVPKAVIVHVQTRKGRGYAPAENHPARFHGTEPFHIENGIPSRHSKKAAYQDVFSTVMIKLAARNEKVVAITAAMADGTGLKRFHIKYPDRFFDVGIAEGHAVTFAAGMALGGHRPILAIYSSFLQRGYDQLIEDVCLQNLPVIIAVDRAGIVGSDGETHQGVFDITYLTAMPNMTVMAPKNKWELSDMLKFALTLDAPVAIRYPRGEAYAGLEEFRAEIEKGKAETIYEGSDILLFALGSMVKSGVAIRDILMENGYNCSLTNARFAKPIDEEYLKKARKDHRLIVTLEENVASGGFGEHVRSCVPDADILTIALPDMFITQGSPDKVKHAIGFDEKSIAAKIMEAFDALK